VGYLIALLLWFSGVVYPISDKPAQAGPPKDFIVDLKFQLRNLRSFVRKGAR
jgi:ABC-type polysaccharide/polyol phosphate export permease